MSSLRARCPDCRTFTAVALDGHYECHRCGRVFQAGLVRVPRAWGAGGDAMADGAFLPVPYPETGVVERSSLEEQTGTLAGVLPERPLVLGGCCCTHVGAVRGLAVRHERLAVVWLDAHGDLNTPETSPSGNLWGMPLRMLLDDGVVAPEDVALVGVRSLDPGEIEYLAETGIDDSLERALAGAEAVYVALDLDVLDPTQAAVFMPEYVALDLDVLDPTQAAVFMPEPDGPTTDELAAVLRDVASRSPVAGVGVTGLLVDERNEAVVTRLLTAAGL